MVPRVVVGVVLVLLLAHPVFAQPRVGLDRDGNAVFTWRTIDAVLSCRARTLSATGVLTAIATVSAANRDAYGCDVAVVPNGRAVFAWAGTDGRDIRAYARTRTPTGTWSAIQAVSPGGANVYSMPTVGVTATGDAVLVWQLEDRITQAVTRSASGVLGAVQTLWTYLAMPIAGIGPGGDAFVFWEGGVSRFRSFDGALSNLQLLTLANARPQAVAVGRDGTAFATWLVGFTTDARLFVRTRSALGVRSPIQRVSPVWAEGADVAVGPDGTAIVVWSGGRGIELRTVAPDGTLGPIEMVGGLYRGGDGPRVVIAPNGDAVVTWLATYTSPYRVVARRRSASGELGPLVYVSSAGEQAFRPAIAIDRRANAMIAWEASGRGILARRLSAAGVRGPLVEIDP